MIFIHVGTFNCRVKRLEKGAGSLQTLSTEVQTEASSSNRSTLRCDVNVATDK